ncbi:MAG: alpha/beta hydrolase [Moraxellaceae bacterium]|nr:alpha/beta hydrolase [Moraxellaceae bacterium]
MSLKDTVTRRVIGAGLRLAFKLPSRLPLPPAVLREGMEQGARLFRLHAGTQVTPVTLGGLPTERISPRHPGRHAILHVHGGAFFAGSPGTHRALGSELAARSGAVVYMIDYRLAPEHPWPAALEDALAAYRALLALGYLPREILLGGDSGGCAHILNLAIALRDQGLPLPAGLFMISPFVDLTLSCPSVAAYRHRDPMVTAYALRRGADGYRGEMAADDPRVSPLFADLHGLPPVLIQAGAEEILRDDALRLATRLTAAGTLAGCRLYPGMWHNFQMFNQFLDVADQALDEIGVFVRGSVRQGQAATAQAEPA